MQQKHSASLAKRLIGLFALLLLVPIVVAHYTITGSSGQIIVPNIATPGNETVVFFRLLDPFTGEPLTVADLLVVHERKIHVFLVGEDLTYFAHVHPEDFPQGARYEFDGQYHVLNTFPASGRYAVIANYVGNGLSTVLMDTVQIQGSPPLQLQEDLARAQNVGQYAITWDGPNEVLTGEEIEFSLFIESNGVPISSLEQYLGADMHMLIIDSNMTNASHLHPYVPGHGIHYGSMAQRYRGPRVPFRHTFASPGLYAIFSQFQHGGEVITVRHMIRVSDPAPVPWRAVLLAGSAVLILLAGVALMRMRGR